MRVYMSIVYEGVQGGVYMSMVYEGVYEHSVHV